MPASNQTASSGQKKITTTQAVIISITNKVGIGMLSLPAALNNLDFFPSILCIIVMSMLSLYTVYNLIALAKVSVHAHNRRQRPHPRRTVGGNHLCSWLPHQHGAHQRVHTRHVDHWPQHRHRTRRLLRRLHRRRRTRHVDHVRPTQHALRLMGLVAMHQIRRCHRLDRHDHTRRPRTSESTTCMESASNRQPDLQPSRLHASVTSLSHTPAFKLSRRGSGLHRGPSGSSDSYTIWLHHDLLSEHLYLFGVGYRLWDLHLRIERLPRDNVADFDLMPKVPRVSSPQLTYTECWRFISHFHLHQLHRASSHLSRVLGTWPVERVYASVAIYDASIAWCVTRSCAGLLEKNAEKAFQPCAG